MGDLPAGRALWEPSSDIDRYGTTLALELLPHFTDGKIGSMEGLYFESAATTPYHFMVVSALAKSPSNPVRGLQYRTLNDFELGVAQMRLMGVRYYMAQSDDAKSRADESPGLEFVTETGSPGVTPSVARWKIYEVLDSALVEPLRNEPVILDGVSHKHWLAPSAAWFDDASALDRPLVDGGPEEWARAGEAEARFTPKKPLPAVTVSNIETGDDSMSFDVSEPGVPVLVKTSYFPNWQVSGAKGPWRVSPNLMVVVPTDTHVSLHYGRTGVDYAGNVLTLLGVVGLVGLSRWKLGRSGPGPAGVASRPSAPRPAPATAPRRAAPATTSETSRARPGIAAGASERYRSGPLWATGSTSSSRRTTCGGSTPTRSTRTSPAGSERLRRVHRRRADRGGPRHAAVVRCRSRRRSSRASPWPAPRSSMPGLASTDLIYFAAGRLDAPGAMFTASHNPAQYNGIKLCQAGAAPVGQDTGLGQIKAAGRRSPRAGRPEGSVTSRSLATSPITSAASSTSRAFAPSR